MILLPTHLFKQYRAYCANSNVNDGDFADYLKWLRYFLDFCEKYQVAGDEASRSNLFLNKLQQKGQSEVKRQQANHAVSLYFPMIRDGADTRPPMQPVSEAQSLEGTTEPTDGPLFVAMPAITKRSFYNASGYQETSDSSEWDEVLRKLADEIKVRHYPSSL